MTHPFDNKSQLISVPVIRYYDEHVLMWRRNQPDQIALVNWLKSVYPGWK